MAHSAYIIVYLLTHQYVPSCTHSSNSPQSSIITEWTGSPFLSPGSYFSFDIHAYAWVTRVHHHQNLALFGISLHPMNDLSCIHSVTHNLYNLEFFTTVVFLFTFWFFCVILLSTLYVHVYLSVLFCSFLVLGLSLSIKIPLFSLFCLHMKFKVSMTLHLIFSWCILIQDHALAFLYTMNLQ